MPLGIEYRIGVDGSSGMSALSSLESKMKQVGNTAKSELAQKLKTVFTVTAIEEAVRRTADWAQQIEQTSKQLGISAEALQALQVIAAKTGLPTDAITGMFENIAKAREEALAGNKDLIVSFQNLGVSLKELQTTTKSQLFSDVMKGIPDNVQNSQNYIRQSAADVTGNTPENYINAVKGQTDGKGFNNYIDEEKKNGSVQSEQTISELSASWSEFLQTLKQDWAQLSPAIIFVVGLLNTLGRALGGLVDVVVAVFRMVKGLATLDFNKFKIGLSSLGSLFMNAGFGILKIVTSFTDLLAKGLLGAAWKINQALGALHIVSKSTVAESKQKYDDLSAPGGGATGMLQELQDKTNAAYQDNLGVGNDLATHGEALGNTAALLGTGGSAAIAKGVTKGLIEGAVVIEKVSPALADKLVNGAIKTEKYSSYKGNVIKQGTENLVTKTLQPIVENKYLSKRAAVSTRMSKWLDNNGNGDIFKSTRYLRRGEKAFVSSRDADIAKWSSRISSFSMFASLAASIATAGKAVNKGVVGGNRPMEATPILPRNGFFQDIGGSKPSMLSMGGTFGSGFQSRVILLNEKMVGYLAQITKYMSYNQVIVPNANNNQPSPNNQPSGGM